MELLNILTVGVVIGFAALIQSAVGFGFLLFATPLILWIGFPLPAVVMLVSTCSTVQAALGAQHLRATVPWRLTFTATGVRLVAVIIGLFLLKRIVSLDVNYIKLVVGSIVGLIVIVKLLLRPPPEEKSHWGWAGFAFVVSGLLSGICGIGGPPLVLWSTAQNWATNRTRAFLFGVLAISTPDTDCPIRSDVWRRALPVCCHRRRVFPRRVPRIFRRTTHWESHAQNAASSHRGHHTLARRR